jgi:hypothetical protein
VAASGQTYRRNFYGADLKTQEERHSPLCAFGFSFSAPLREQLVFLAKAQRENLRRKGLSLGFKDLKGNKSA